MTMPSLAHGTAESAFSLDSPQSRSIAWSAVHRIAFRFAFSFIVLALFRFPFGAGSVYETTWYARTWFAVASWLCTHILHVPPTPTPPTPVTFTLADNMNGYVELMSFVVLAGLAAIVWTLLDHKRPHYRTLHEWLRIYVRYALALAMLGYGFDKVFALQFNWSLPGPQRLAEPLGNYSPVALMWTFMGYSKPYTIFAGIGEVVGGFLLFFRRTTTLGALLICGVMANVVALDFSYDVGVRIEASLIVALAIFLLVPELRRLINFFVLNRPTPAADLNGAIPMNRTRIVLHAGLVVFALYWSAGPSLDGPRERGQRPKSPLYGLYHVEGFTQNGKQVEQNDANWRRVIFEGKNDMTVLAMDDSMHYYAVDVDLTESAVTISGERDLDSDQENQNLPKSVLTFSRPDSDHLEFRGDLVWSKNSKSCGLGVVVIQHSAKALAPPHNSILDGWRFRPNDQTIAEPLVIPL